jgi:hypothetical protein
LQPVVTQAIANLAMAGYNVSGLGRVQFHVAALPDSLLGLTYQNTIWIDANAQGYGWYIDASPRSIAAFAHVTGTHQVQATPRSPAYGHIDLLTVVTHELGHVLGFASIDPGSQGQDWMTATLGPGVRRSPDPAHPTATVPTSDGWTGAIASPSPAVIASLVPSSGPSLLGPTTPRPGAGAPDGSSTGLEAIAAPSPVDLVDASLLDPALGGSLDGRQRAFVASNLRRETARRPEPRRPLAAMRPEQVDALLEHVARHAVAQAREESAGPIKAGRLPVSR